VHYFFFSHVISIKSSAYSNASGRLRSPFNIATGFVLSSRLFSACSRAAYTEKDDLDLHSTVQGNNLLASGLNPRSGPLTPPGVDVTSSGSIPSRLV